MSRRVVTAVGMVLLLLPGCGEDDEEPAIAAPSELQVTGFTTSSVFLWWRDNSDNEDGFRVYRSTDGTDFTEVGTSTFLTVYTDSTVTESVLYYYRVTAHNATDESSPSNTVTATPEPYYVTVTCLNSTDALTIGATYSITWETNYPSFDARILLSLDGGSTWPHVILSSWGNNGTSFPWKVGYKDTAIDPPNHQWEQVVSSIETQCLILVRDYDTASICDENDAEFTIQP